MRIPNLSLYLRMVEFEFETEYKFEFEIENKIFCEYQPRERSLGSVSVETTQGTREILVLADINGRREI